MENLKNEEILLQLIDIVMGNKHIKALPITELAFENHDNHHNYSGYVFEIEHLLTKLGLFNFSNEFSNVHYLWYTYKYNLSHNLFQNEELENELWGVLLNAELIHDEEQQSMTKEDIQNDEHYEDDFEEESNEEIIEEIIEEIKEESNEEIKEESNEEIIEEIKEESNEEIIEEIKEENDNSSWCVII